MAPLRILHIVPWFPHPQNEIEAIFIAKHLVSIKDYFDNRILHIRFDEKKQTDYNLSYQEIPLDRIQLKPFINKWRIKELMASSFINRYLKKRENSFDIVNFYIAYPNAISIAKFQQRYPKITFTITEQWSAYHIHFNLPEQNKGRKRIEAIFKTDTPLIVVSNALGQDIREFSKVKNLHYSEVPNIVDEKTFSYVEKNQGDTFTFCSINNWSSMKNPILLIEAFSLLEKDYPNVRLILGGSGELDKQIDEKVNSLNLTEKITRTGRISKKEVANLLCRSNIYCQSSNYETFSAICIEALATGTPVIATNIGGMKDFIDSENGLLVDLMDSESWRDSMEEIMKNYSKYNLKEISAKSISRFNERAVGQNLYETIRNLSDGK